MMDIPEFESLLKPLINGNKIINYETHRLTALGDNYGSLMLALDLRIKTPSNEEEVIKLVAKKLPESEFLREMFGTCITFKKELELYRTIVPTLAEFQQKQGLKKSINFIAEYYNGRVSQNPNATEIDEDAIIILENLKVSGYKTASRLEGFDLDATIFILKDLAVFHALPIALKIRQPETFREKILPHLKTFNLFKDMSEKLKEVTIESVLDIVNADENCRKYSDRVQLAMHRGLSSRNCEVREPFATLVHNDYWVNNTMIKVVDDEVKGNKIIDFQLIDYGSPAKDIVFFLFSSVPIKILKQYYQELIDIYYDTFIATLHELNCETKQFSYDLFLKELRFSAMEFEFAHLLSMFPDIFIDAQNLIQLKDMDEENTIASREISKLAKEKTLFVVEEFAERGWI